MPKDKRARQTKKRKGRRPTGVADWSGPTTKHGPFGIFSNVKLFYILGVIIMGGSLAGGGMSVCARGSGGQAVTPTPTSTAVATAEVTPSATGTPSAVKQYEVPPPMTIDPEKSYFATIKTEKGDVRVELFAKDAPNTVNNFVFLARDGFYDGLPFYLVYPDFYVQTGDPTGTGTGGPGYEIAKEPNDRPFVAGTLGGVAQSEEEMANGSQFFIALEPSKQFETGDFWAFGQVVEGLDVVESLVQGDKILGIEVEEQ
jgi:cyclophilin family peptidyl-prolyl cis-trans isomerase